MIYQIQRQRPVQADGRVPKPSGDAAERVELPVDLVEATKQLIAIALISHNPP
jgi:hypothetical protein